MPGTGLYRVKVTPAGQVITLVTGRYVATLVSSEK